MEDIEEIKDFLEWGEDRVYFLLGLARPKENQELTDNSKPAIRLIVKDEEDFDRKLERMRHAVKRFDFTFRIYISINARNTVKTYFNYRNEMDDWVKSVFMGRKDANSMGHFKRMDKRWKSELQKSRNKDETYFLFDVDNENPNARSAVEDAISEEDAEILMTRETPNGWHIITEPFNYKEMATPSFCAGTPGRAEVEDFEIKTDGMLYLEMIE